MPISRELALTPGQLDEIMLSTWNMRIATIGPGSRINVTPLWFGWAGGKTLVGDSYGAAKEKTAEQRAARAARKRESGREAGAA